MEDDSVRLPDDPVDGNDSGSDDGRRPSPKKRNYTSPRYLLPLAAAVVAVVVAIVLLLTLPGEGSPQRALLSQAYEECGPSLYIQLQDDGNTLSWDHKGDEDSGGISLDEVVCILDVVGVPDSVVNHMSQTTSMDGRQTATWDGLEAQWSYHPDRGLDGQIVVVGK